MDDDAMTTEEFVQAFELVIGVVTEARNLTERELLTIKEACQEVFQKLDNQKNEMFADIKERLLKLIDSKTSEFETKTESKLKDFEARVDKIENGKEADEERLTSQILSLIPPAKELQPETGEGIIQKINENDTILINSEKVEGLDEKLKDLDEKITNIPKSRGGGGVSAIGVAQAFKYIAKTEQPVGLINGSNTTYTVSSNIWWIAGFTLNGENIAQLPNFTFAGRTITFSSALPSAYSGKDFEIKYIGT